MTIDDLMRASPSPDAARAIVDYVRELPGRIVRGDMMIGILSPAELERVPIALEQAAGYGDPAAWLELARWHAHPPYGKPDLVAMERALRAGRDAGVRGAVLETVRLRWFFRRSDTTPEEQRDTFVLAQDLAKAEPQDPVALYYLGLLTCQGFGTTPDPAAAATLQQEAAALGNTDAMFELSVQYDMGLGLEQDPRTAFEWTRKAAEGGHARAMYNMGACCATGRHVPMDPAGAAKWYQRASDLGNVRALAMLAVLYARGEGVEQDLEHARELFDEADYMGFDTSHLRTLVGLEVEGE